MLFQQGDDKAAKQDQCLIDLQIEKIGAVQGMGAEFQPSDYWLW